MIRILIPKSIKYQVSWYIFGTVSVSVSLIHFRCISIINHWYMTVIHLLELFRTLYWQSLQIVDSCVEFNENFENSTASCQHFQFKVSVTQVGLVDVDSIDCCVSWWCCAVIKEIVFNFTICLQGTWRESEKSLIRLTVANTQDKLYHSLHQLKDCSARLDRSKCHATTIWVTVSMFEKLLPLNQITVYFKTGFYWHYYLCFSLMALILQFTFWCKLCVRLLVLLCLHFCVF